MIRFAECCGLSLARSYARSGGPAIISGYFGESDTFDKTIAALSIAYADQVESDCDAVKKAAGGRLLEVLIEKK